MKVMDIPLAMAVMFLRIDIYGTSIAKAETSVARASALAWYPKLMEIHLIPDQQAFLRQAIESGRLADEEDAMREALELWEERERERAETLAAIEVAEAAVAGGRERALTAY